MRLRFWERFKGAFDVLSGSAAASPKQWTDKPWRGRCKWADDIYNNHNLAKSQVLTIAGHILANDLYLDAAKRPRTDPEGKPIEEPYGRALEARDECERLNTHIRHRTLIFESATRIAKYGSVFWEKTADPDYNVRLIPKQEWIVPAALDRVEGVTSWQQIDDNNRRLASWGAEEIVHVAWNVTSQSWPYGTSLYIGLENEFDTLAQLEIDIKEYMHKSAFPLEVYGFGKDINYSPSDDDLAVLKRKFAQWVPGQRMVTNFPIAYVAGGTGNRKIENLNEVLRFLKDNIVDGLMMPPISSQYNSTEASASVMMGWAHASLIQPLQWLFAQALEEEVYAPYLASKGYSVRYDVPSVLWETPDMNKTNEAAYWSGLVSAGICPPGYAARKLGIPEDEFKAWEEEKQRLEAEKLQAQKVQPFGKVKGDE